MRKRKLKGRFLMICVILLLFMPACTVKRKVSYSLRQIETVEISPFHNRSLGIRILKDARKPIEGELVKYRKAGHVGKKKYGSLIRINGVDWWYNKDEFYKSDSLNHAITNMMARHIDESKIFSNVTIIKNQNLEDIQQEYILEGVVKKFEGFQERTEQAEAVSGGLIGNLAALTIKSRCEGTTELELTLIERESGEIIWEGLICGFVDGEASASTDSYGGYNVANTSLYNAVNNFIKEIELLGKAVATLIN
ncbi:MAG: hypothetical protein U9N72_05240 [Bacteroidota bacterium]|nr:hypothetical protein [Bacteroidota bacterium]